MKNGALVFCLIAIFMVSGCAGPMTKTEKGTAVGVGVGAATGALLGQAIGHNTGSTLLGAAAGAVVGGIAGNMIGSYMDRQEEEMRKAVAHRKGTRVERRQNNLTVTMKSDVLFDSGSYALKPGGYDEVRRIADILVRYPETRVIVEGHTDSTGSERYNQELSEYRARAVADALVQDGVNAARITAQGFGESRPVATNATETGKQMNRRVTIHVIPVEAG